MSNFDLEKVKKNLEDTAATAMYTDIFTNNCIEEGIYNNESFVVALRNFEANYDTFKRSILTQREIDILEAHYSIPDRRYCSLDAAIAEEGISYSRVKEIYNRAIRKLKGNFNKFNYVKIQETWVLRWAVVPSMLLDELDLPDTIINSLRVNNITNVTLLLLDYHSGRLKDLISTPRRKEDIIAKLSDMDLIKKEV